MSNKFGKIKTADELDKAILSVKAGQKALGTGISKDAQHLLDSIKPSSLVNNFVSGLLPSSTTLSDAGIGLVQGLKKIFTGPDKSDKPAKKKVRKKAEEAAAEAVEETLEAEPAAEPEPETQAD